MQKPLVLSIAPYDEMAAEIAWQCGYEIGEIERANFPDGERYRRLLTSSYGRDVVLIGGTISDEATLEVFDLACTAVKMGARTLTLVIPFFGYATMERATKSGEVVTAKTRARLLSSIPDAADGSCAVLIDLHAEGIPHYFEGNLRTEHLYAKPVVLDAIRKLGGRNFVLGSTDAGRAKWVESLANELGVSAGFILKRRIDGARTEVVALSADVQGKAVVIYDDMIRTGGSLLHAADAYRAAGASTVSVVATHGVFPEGAVSRLKSSGRLAAVSVTDSHPRAVSEAAGWVAVHPLAPLIADHLASTWPGSRR